jgi:hypothetical protein
MNLNDFAYLLSALLGLASLVVAACALWLVVEAIHFIYCKLTGRKY